MKRFFILAAALAASAAFAQGITSQQADAILQELRQIRTLLERGAAAPAVAQPQAPRDDAVTMKLDGAYVLGKVDSPVTMVEFTDYECPFCRRFHSQSFDEIKRKYIDTGKVRYVSRDFPLDFHPRARPAAKVARCAGEQGRFWEMRKALFEKGGALDTETMMDLAKEMRLEPKKLIACLDGGQVDKAITDDMTVGRNLGISGTPTFVIGRSSGDAVIGTRVVGAQPLANFETQIQALLGK